MKLSNELKRIVKKFFIRTGISAGIILLLALWVMILFSSSDDTVAKKVAMTMMIAFLGIAVLINLCIAIFTIPYKTADKKMKKSGEKRAEREYKKEKITSIDKSKYEGYYKDILSLNSPLVVSYIDDFQIEETDLIAELFHLKMRGVIDILDDKIVLLKEKEETQNEVHKYIIDCIRNNQKLIVNKNILEKTIAADTFNLGLVQLSGINYEKIDANAEKIKKRIEIMLCVIIFLIPFGTLVILGDSGIQMLIELIAPIVAIILFMLTSTYHDSYKNRSKSIHENLPFKRTKKVEEINEKIEGLKNYIADYSMLDERNLEEITLWEDYLVYSVLWKQNKNAIEEYKKYIKFEEEEEENV